jgi:hypothetical protein
MARVSAASAKRCAPLRKGLGRIGLEEGLCMLDGWAIPALKLAYKNRLSVQFPPWVAPVTSDFFRRIHKKMFVH